MNSTTPIHTVGIDLAKLKFDACILQADTLTKCQASAFSNQPEHFVLFEQWLLDQGVNPDSCLLCLESTGSYGQLLTGWLYQQGWQVSVANPARICAYAKARALRVKTDPVDAACIAHFAATQRPHPWSPPPKEMSQLRRYWVRREQLQKQISQENSAREACLDEEVQAWIDTILEVLRSQLKNVQETMQALLDQCEHLRQQSELLRTIPGIGEGSVAPLIAFFGSRSFESARQAAAFAGLTAVERQSGTSVRGRPHISKMGDPLIRKQLWYPAIVAKRHEDFASWTTSMRQDKHKAEKVIICAVMRKLIHIAYGVLSSNQPYEAKRAFPQQTR